MIEGQPQHDALVLREGYEFSSLVIEGQPQLPQLPSEGRPDVLQFGSLNQVSTFQLGSSYLQSATVQGYNPLVAVRIALAGNASDVIHMG